MTNFTKNYQKSNFLTVRSSVFLSWYVRTDMAKERDPFYIFKLRKFENYYIVVGVICWCNFLFQPPLA
jgi:hypothetical protein